MMYCRQKGALCIAFGAGLIIATCLPYSVLVIVIAILLVMTGAALCRY